MDVYKKASNGYIVAITLIKQVAHEQQVNIAGLSFIQCYAEFLYVLNSLIKLLAKLSHNNQWLLLELIPSHCYSPGYSSIILILLVWSNFNDKLWLKLFPLARRPPSMAMLVRSS